MTSKLTTSGRPTIHLMNNSSSKSTLSPTIVRPDLLKSPYTTFYQNTFSPRLSTMPMKSEEAEKYILNEMSFMIKQKDPKKLNRKIWGSIESSKKSRQQQRVIYTQEEAIPLVQKELSALMAQRIKVRDPTDMLKIQARVKNDLEGMHHAN